MVGISGLSGDCGCIQSRGYKIKVDKNEKRKKNTIEEKSLKSGHLHNRWPLLLTRLAEVEKPNQTNKREKRQSTHCLRRPPAGAYKAKRFSCRHEAAGRVGETTLPAGQETSTSCERSLGFSALASSNCTKPAAGRSLPQSSQCEHSFTCPVGSQSGRGCSNRPVRKDRDRKCKVL